MATIPVQAQPSYDELLKAVEQLSKPDFEKFVSQVISLRARKKGKNLSKNEAELLLKINRRIDPKTKKRYDELISKRRAETLTSKEHNELLKISQEIEKSEAKRVKCLSQLSQLRQTSLSALMKELGIQNPAYD